MHCRQVEGFLDGLRRRMSKSKMAFDINDFNTYDDVIFDSCFGDVISWRRFACMCNFCHAWSRKDACAHLSVVFLPDYRLDSQWRHWHVHRQRPDVQHSRRGCNLWKSPNSLPASEFKSKLIRNPATPLNADYTTCWLHMPITPNAHFSRWLLLTCTYLTRIHLCRNIIYT